MVVPANLPRTPSGFVPTQKERKEEVARKRKEEGDPTAGYTSSESFSMSGFGIRQKDLRGNPMIHWHSKNKHVRLSTALPSWKSPRITRHAHIAISALYGKRNLSELKKVPVADLPLLASQASANSMVTTHYVGTLARDLLKENEQLQKDNKVLKERNARLGKKVVQQKEELGVAYDLENNSFQAAMLPFVKETVEVAIERLIRGGFTKEGVDGVPFLELFPELAPQIAAMERAKKGKDIIEEEEGEEVEEEEEEEEEEGRVQGEGQGAMETEDDTGSSQRGGEQSAESSTSASSSAARSSHSESASSTGSDNSGSGSGGYSPEVDIDGLSPAPPAEKKQKTADD